MRAPRQPWTHVVFVSSWLLAKLLFVITVLRPATMGYNEKYMSKLLSNRTLVEDGISLNGTSLFEVRYDETEFSVRCILNIENWGAWLLTDPIVHNHCGYIDDNFPVPVVFPATREIMVGLKQTGTATGTCGTVSWQIQNLNLRLIVMWSVPFNLNIHDSYVALGMVYNEGRFGSSGYWFNQMYYGENGPFKRAGAGKAITFENDKVVVHGFMESDTYTPLLNISVIPQIQYRLAPAIWKKLYGSSQWPRPNGANTAWTSASLPSIGMAILVIINVLCNRKRITVIS